MGRESGKEKGSEGMGMREVVVSTPTDTRFANTQRERGGCRSGEVEKKGVGKVVKDGGKVVTLKNLRVDLDNKF